MSLRIASFLLVLITSLFAGHVSKAAAQAVESSSRVPSPIAARPMPASARLRLFGAGFGGAVLAGGASAAVGFGVYQLTVCRPHGEDDCDHENTSLQGIVQGAATAFGLAVITMPLASAALTQRVGRRGGYAGRFRGALIGSIVGTGVGLATAGTTFYLATTVWETHEPEPIVAASLTGIATIAGFGMLGYRLSDRRVTNLTPAVAPHAGGHGLSIGVSGRF